MPKTVTFRMPRSMQELNQWLKQAEPIIKTAKTVMVAFVLITLVGMRDVFTSIEFSPEVSGIIVWVFAMWALLTVGLK